MRFVENCAAGWGVREFHNLDPPPEGERPGHLDLGWSYMVRQVGTSRTGRVEHVTVHYRPRGKRTFTGREADRVLRVVQQHRTDAAASYAPRMISTASW